MVSKNGPWLHPGKHCMKAMGISAFAVKVCFSRQSEWLAAGGPQDFAAQLRALWCCGQTFGLWHHSRLEATRPRGPTSKALPKRTIASWTKTQDPVRAVLLNLWLGRPNEDQTGNNLARSVRSLALRLKNPRLCSGKCLQIKLIWTWWILTPQQLRSTGSES